MEVSRFVADPASGRYDGFWPGAAGQTHRSADRFRFKAAISGEQAGGRLEADSAGAKEPSVEIQLMDTTGYQAMPFSIEKAFVK
jgi:hypothetical protein